MKTLPGFRIESFTHPERGVVVAVIVAGHDAATGETGAFLVVGADGIPSVYAFDAAALRRDELAEIFDAATANPGRRADWSGAKLSDGLAFFGFNPREADTAAAVCARAAESLSGGKINRRDAQPLIQQKLDAALAPALAVIDKDALRALRVAPTFSKSDFTFYAKGDAAKERQLKLRLQAATAYPILAAAMARNLRAKLAIDGAKPLNEELIAAFGNHRNGRPIFSKALLRRFQGLEWPIPANVSPEWLAGKVGALSPDWFPKTPEEWNAFLTVASGLGRTLPQTLGVEFQDLVAASGGKWVDFRKRLAKSFLDTRPPEDLDEDARREFLRDPPQPDESVEALQNAVIDLEDMVDQFTRLVVLPAAAKISEKDDPKPTLGEPQRSAARLAAAQILFGGKTATAMFEISRHYHTQAEHVQEEALGHEIARPGEFKQVAEDGWAPLCNQVQAPNGVWIVPLTDPRELVDEGRGYSGTSARNADGTDGLGHCVGGYASTCRSSGHHILSFRTLDAEKRPTRLSTIEISPVSENSLDLNVRQHKGPHNRKPAPESEQAWTWFQDQVANRSIVLNYAGIRAYFVTQMKKFNDDVESSCGYEWKEEGALERALGAFGEWLPKNLRQGGTSTLLALPEVAAVADKIFPKRMAVLGNPTAAPAYAAAPTG